VDRKIALNSRTETGKGNFVLWLSLITENKQYNFSLAKNYVLIIENCCSIKLSSLPNPDKK
jgi:hypothetical protein